MNFELANTSDIPVATKKRSGYATTLGPVVAKMSPGDALKIDVIFDDLEGLEGDDAFKKYIADNKVKVRKGEEQKTSITRHIASQQRTRIMAALDLKNAKHYFHSVLMAPEDGCYQQIAVICEPIENKPKRAPRKTKSK